MLLLLLKGKNDKLCYIIKASSHNERKGGDIMKKTLIKPNKKVDSLKKINLFNAPRPNNENCDCCSNGVICIK